MAIAGCNGDTQSSADGSVPLNPDSSADATADALPMPESGKPDASAPDAGDAAQADGTVEVDADASADAPGNIGDVAGDGAHAGDGGVVKVSGVCSADGRWCLYDPYPFGGLVTSIWGASVNDLWVSTSLNMSSSLGALHYDGTSWTRYFVELASLFGTGSADVWATVPSGSTALMHWDGTQWSRVPTVSSFNLASVWADSPTDVFASGATGTIVHFDGTTWTKQSTGTISDLESLWGFGPSDVWVSSSSGILHYDGSKWSSQNATINGGLWGTSGSDLWACGAGCSHWDGGSWSPLIVGPSVGGYFGRSRSDVLFSILDHPGAPEDTVVQWTGQSDGGVATVFPPSSPTSACGRSVEVVAVAGGEYVVGSDPCFVGDRLVHGSPGSWTSLIARGLPPLGGPSALVWNAGGGTYYHVIGQTNGSLSLGIATEQGGTLPATWTQKGDIGVGVNHPMHAIWGSSASDVWVVGEAGIATHYDGNAWTAQSLQGAALTDVWGSGPSDFWATGGASYHWNGQQWTATGPGGAVVSGTASNDVWLAGNSSTSHWDGSMWTTYALDLVVGNDQVARLNAFAANDAWLVTTLGDVFHWNGSMWVGKASAFCSTALDAGGCSSPLFAPAGSGASGFVWNASGDGWVYLSSFLSAGTWTSGMWHTTGNNFSPADATPNDSRFLGPEGTFGGPGNAWSGGGTTLWKLR